MGDTTNAEAAPVESVAKYLARRRKEQAAEIEALRTSPNTVDRTWGEAGRAGLDNLSSAAASAVNAAPTAALSTANAATFGATGVAETTGRALWDQATEGDQSFREAYSDAAGDIAQRRAEHPVADFAGELTGSILGANKVLKAAEKAVPKVATNFLHRLLFGATLGATQNVGVQAGNNEIDSLRDAGTQALWGAGAGTVGELAGSAGVGAGRAIAHKLGFGVEQAAMARTRASLTNVDSDSMYDATFRTSNPDGSLMDQMRNADVGENQILADAMPDRMLSETVGMARAPENLGSAGPLRDQMTDRINNLDAGASDLADKFIRPDVSAGSFRATTKEQIALAQPAYATMLSSPEAVSRSVSRADIAAQIRTIVPEESGGATKATRDWMQARVNAAGDITEETGDPNNISPAMLLAVNTEIQTELSAIIAGTTQSSLDKSAIVHLTRYSEAIRKLVSDSVPTYSQAASAYSIPKGIAEARVNGAEAFRNSKLDAEDITNLISAIGTPAQAEAFRSGVLESLVQKSSSGAAELRRLIKPNSNEADKIRAALLKPEDFDTYVAEAQQLVEEASTGRSIMSAVDGQARNVPSGAANVGNNLTTSAALMGSGRAVLGFGKLMNSLDDTTVSRSNQILQDLYQTNGQEKVDAAIAIIEAAPQKEQNRLLKLLTGGQIDRVTGGMAGSAAAVSSHAGPELGPRMTGPDAVITSGSVPQGLMEMMVPPQPWEQGISKNNRSIMDN